MYVHVPMYQSMLCHLYVPVTSPDQWVGIGKSIAISIFVFNFIQFNEHYLQLDNFGPYVSHHQLQFSLLAV